MREKDDKLCTFQIRIYRLNIGVVQLEVQKEVDLFQISGEILTELMQSTMLLLPLQSEMYSGLPVNVTTE